MSDSHAPRPRRAKALSAGLCLLAVATPAHAYMDPGSMSVVVTAVLGALAAVGYTARLYWARFKDLVGRLFRRARPSPPDE